MRLRSFRGTPLSSAALIALLLIVSAPVAAQTSTRSDEAASRTAALAARLGAARVGAIARSARDVVRSTAGDTAALAGPLPTPYRSTLSQDAAPGGFAMRLPGTGLDLTNGSLSIRHSNDGRYARGVHFSMQLTY